MRRIVTLLALLFVWGSPVFADVPAVPGGGGGSSDTELPAAAALTDNFANPTAPAVGAFLMCWDGATWDRCPGTSADGLKVQQGGTWTVQPGNTANTTPWLTKPHDGTNPLFVAAAALGDNIANPTTTIVGAVSLFFDGTTYDRVSSTMGLPVNVIATSVGTSTGADDGDIASGATDTTIVAALCYGFDGTSHLRCPPHDAVDNAGAPSRIGARATTSLSALTMVANADVTRLYAGTDGVLFTRPHSNLEDIVSAVASNTDGTSTVLIAAGAAGIKHYLTKVACFNTSASNIYVEINDGATVKWRMMLPTLGGTTESFETPIAGTAATAWNFDPSAAATTVYCGATVFKSKV